MKESEEQAIKRVSKYLITGATMLGMSCPICNVPLLKKGEKIFCAGCEREVELVSSQKEAEALISKNEEKKCLKRTKDILLKKLEILTTCISTENDISGIKEKLEAIEMTIKIVKDISNFSNKK